MHTCEPSSKANCSVPERKIAVLKQKSVFPPHGADPDIVLLTTEPVELPDKGMVTTFVIINIPFMDQRTKPPYVAAYVLLDGANILFLTLDF